MGRGEAGRRFANHDGGFSVYTRRFVSCMEFLIIDDGAGGERRTWRCLHDACIGSYT